MEGKQWGGGHCGSRRRAETCSASRTAPSVPCYSLRRRDRPEVTSFPRSPRRATGRRGGLPAVLPGRDSELAPGSRTPPFPDPGEVDSAAASPQPARGPAPEACAAPSGSRWNLDCGALRCDWQVCGRRVGAAGDVREGLPGLRAGHPGGRSWGLVERAAVSQILGDRCLPLPPEQVSVPGRRVSLASFSCVLSPSGQDSGNLRFLNYCLCAAELVSTGPGEDG